MIAEIYKRRSIRKYQDKPIPKQDILDIVQSAMKAPSPKNRQPWRFIVVKEKEKDEMLHAFRQGIFREETGNALLPQSKEYIEGAKYTVKVLEQAPVIVFVVNALGKDLTEERTPEEYVYDICNIQSIGAAIQNMLLTATEKGIGSLWVCDTYFAYPELCRWLNVKGEFLAAVAFGYPDEKPDERPRKRPEDVLEWRN